MYIVEIQRLKAKIVDPDEKAHYVSTVFANSAFAVFDTLRGNTFDSPEKKTDQK